MNLKNLTTAALLILFLMPLGQCFAWNDRTHMLIAFLAFQELTPERQEELHAILKNHPHYKSFLIQDRPEGCPESLWAFMRAGIWPDYIGKYDPTREEVRAEYHRLRWHFVNIPYVPPQEGVSMAEVRLTVFSPNILTAIDENTDIFTESYSSDSRKAIALCWLIHLFGDVHQPLHCVNLYSERFPDGDQGGNRIAIRDGENLTKLHSFWDNLLGEDRSLEGIEETAQMLSDQQPSLENDDDRKWPSWAQKSHELALKHAYLDGRLPLVQWQNEFQSDTPSDQVPSLPSDYKDDAISIAKVQVSLASVRLSRFLLDK